MALRDSETAQRSGNDMLLQEIPDGFVAYRKVANNPAAETDFQSYYELGIWQSLRRPFRGYAVLGVSFYVDRARAQRLVNTAHRRGEPAWIATMTLAGGAGLWGIYNAKTTHLEVFALPHDLVARVDRVD